jgi:hypothetical protein
MNEESPLTSFDVGIDGSADRHFVDSRNRIQERGAPRVRHFFRRRTPASPTLRHGYLRRRVIAAIWLGRRRDGGKRVVDVIERFDRPAREDNGASMAEDSTPFSCHIASVFRRTDSRSAAGASNKCGRREKRASRFPHQIPSAQRGVRHPFAQKGRHDLAGQFGFRPPRIGGWPSDSNKRRSDASRCSRAAEPGHSAACRSNRDGWRQTSRRKRVCQ